MKRKLAKVYVYQDVPQSQIDTILDYLLGVYKDIRIYIRNYNCISDDNIRPIDIQFDSSCGRDDCRYICSCLSSDDYFKYDVNADFDGNEENFAGMTSIDFDNDHDWILDYKYNPDILWSDESEKQRVVYFKQDTTWNKIEYPKDSIWHEKYF